MKLVIKSCAIFFVLFFGLILFILQNQIGGWRAFIVQSGSMEPTIKTGSLIITKYASPDSLQRNDIITFIAPVKSREFVTHRIAKIVKQKNLAIIKTKGDKNKNEDFWVLAGGAVVGKVIYTFPYFGYLFSLTKTKIGILFFILLPASFLIINEISYIINILNKKHISNNPIKNVASSCLMFFLFVLFSSIKPTFALLSDSSGLTNNSFTADVINPTPTPTPTPSAGSGQSSSCGGSININISNNAAGSSNNASTSNSCSTTIIQTNNQTTIHNIYYHQNVRED